MMRDIRIVQTAKNTGDRLTEKNSIEFTEEKAHGPVIKIDTNKRFQRILGFGGAFTEAASYTLSRMSEEKQKEIIDSYFSERGLGYSMGRLHMHSCDFALSNYTYVEDEDKELKSFNIAREEKWVLPFLEAAKRCRGEELLLLASPWSPPAWMKSNKDMNNGGKLLPEYKETWAKYYVKYIKAMRKKGINIWGITVQNEPAAVQCWDSCIYSAEEEKEFVKDYLGPIFEKEGLSNIKIYIWDHNRDILVERAKGVLEDSEAAKYIYGVANHWYVSEAFENLSKVHEMYPDKHILFSEGCQEGGVHLGSWDTGERYGRNMIGDFNNWQEGWLDWNLILDEMGGPNHVGNYCDAAIIADTRTQELHYNSSYYYLGQFSKYVKPGAERIETCLQGNTSVKFVGFLNKDGSVVIILQNEEDYSQQINLSYDGKNAGYAMPEHSIATLIFSAVKN